MIVQHDRPEMKSLTEIFDAVNSFSGEWEGVLQKHSGCVLEFGSGMYGFLHLNSCRLNGASMQGEMMEGEEREKGFLSKTKTLRLSI